jgi:carboxylate-amine ligase
VWTAETHLREAGERLQEAADAMGVWICGGGTHPFAGAGRPHQVWDNPRYHAMLERNQYLSRQGVIFGLHVHVGARNGEHAIQLINGVSPYLAYLIGLSGCSPFLHGEDTGLASTRPTIQESKPTSGPAPGLHSWQEFLDLTEGLKRAGAIASHKELHWDIRPSPIFGTVEVRICDQPLTITDSVALTAVIHWLFGWIDERVKAGARFSPVPTWRLRENKWRALRYGMDAEVIVDDSGRTAPLREEWGRLLTVLEPVAWRLGSADYLRDVVNLMERPGYRRMRELLAGTKSLRRVVEDLTDVWRDDVLPISPVLEVPIREDLPQPGSFQQARLAGRGVKRLFNVSS